LFPPYRCKVALTLKEWVGVRWLFFSILGVIFMDIRCLPNILRNFSECFTIIDDLFHFISFCIVHKWFFDLMSFLKIK
jgi:hypothetical protein